MNAAPQPPAVSVIVPARNAAATIAATLSALASQDLSEPYEVVVVDDGSDDDTAAMAEGSPGPLRVLRAEGAGPGPARNAGVNASRGAVLAFTDADCAPSPDWLRSGLAAMRTADLVQGRVEPDPDARLGPFDHTVWVVGESGLYVGTCSSEWAASRISWAPGSASRLPRTSGWAGAHGAPERRRPSVPMPWSTTPCSLAAPPAT
jgi:glycosyltransferase involved in cell wall biosynthesis